MRTERMTWEEIAEKYPDKWVGLSEVEWESPGNPKTAVVTYVGDEPDEPLDKHLDGEDIHALYTSPDHLLPFGALTWEICR